MKAAELTETDLRTRWPKIFNDERRALKIGIDIDMKLDGPCPALAEWVNHPNYLRRLIAPAARRYDLNGKPCGEVDDWVRSHARWKLSQLGLPEKPKRPTKAEQLKQFELEHRKQKRERLLDELPRMRELPQVAERVKFLANLLDRHVFTMKELVAELRRRGFKVRDGGWPRSRIVEQRWDFCHTGRCLFPMNPRAMEGMDELLGYDSERSEVK